jgi:AraC-like DNA-binding protein
MLYKTISPGTVLSAFVKCYWTLDVPKETKPEKQRIVPDGCMEMIFHYGDLFKQYFNDGHYIIQPRCFVFGQITLPLDIEPTGDIGIFAIRFYPEGFAPFATMPISQMENRAVPLEELFGDEGHRLGDAILRANSNEYRVGIVETFLLSKFTPESIDLIAKSTVAVLMHFNGQTSIDELSAHFKINRRLLERKFSSIIGLSPKQLSKMIRLQATLKMLANKQFTSLTSVALEGNYYDQAHFIKDFKEFTGMTPKNFYSDNLAMSALFINTE